VALALALHHPARVRSLTLVNTFAKYRSPGYLHVAHRLWLVTFAPMSAVAAFVAGRLFPRPDQRPLYEAAVASLSRNSKRTYFAAMRAIARFDVHSQLGAIHCPALVVAGDRDLTIPLASKEALQRGLPNAKLLVIPDSGHATPYDQAEAFNRAVLEFIGGH
jgi:pimeloyl-ACP methyl ester carboxylesterase